MRYRVYSGPQGSGPINALGKSRMPFKEFDTLDDALIGARQIIATGHTVQLIEGDDGTRLGKEDVAAAINHPDVRSVKAGPAA
jgi:hypothetical protein